MQANPYATMCHAAVTAMLAELPRAATAAAPAPVPAPAAAGTAGDACVPDTHTQAAAAAQPLQDDDDDSR